MALEIDIDALPPSTQYKLLASTVVPRPIALISTWSAQGGDNAAPFSFFNVMGEDPPVLVVGLENRRDSGQPKHTAVNIQENGEFVVHMVDEPLAEAMNLCARDLPFGSSEAEAAGLTLTPSRRIQPQRIVEAPIAFECEKVAMLQISPGRWIAIGRVVMMHAREGLFDPETWRIDTQAYRPVGRMHGSLYTRTREHFEMRVPAYTPNGA